MSEFDDDCDGFLECDEFVELVRSDPALRQFLGVHLGNLLADLNARDKEEQRQFGPKAFRDGIFDSWDRVF